MDTCCFQALHLVPMVFQVESFLEALIAARVAFGPFAADPAKLHFPAATGFAVVVVVAGRAISWSGDRSEATAAAVVLLLLLLRKIASRWNHTHVAAAGFQFVFCLNDSAQAANTYPFPS